jgi:hypothetical protein
MKIVRGRNDRRPVTIQQLDSAGGRIVNAWRLDDAWPCCWSGPSFNAVGNEVAIEELELAYEELVRLAEPGTPKSMSRSRTKREGAGRGAGGLPGVQRDRDVGRCGRVSKRQ